MNKELIELINKALDNERRLIDLLFRLAEKDTK